MLRGLLAYRLVGLPQRVGAFLATNLHGLAADSHGDSRIIELAVTGRTCVVCHLRLLSGLAVVDGPKVHLSPVRRCQIL